MAEEKSDAHDAALTEEQLQQNSCHINSGLVQKSRRDTSKSEEGLMLPGK